MPELFSSEAAAQQQHQTLMQQLQTSSAQPSSKSPPSSLREHGTKWLPVLFVWLIILGLYGIYMGFHCVPEMNDPDRHGGGVLDTVIFNVVFAMLSICYVLSITVHPGTIPSKEEDPSGAWQYANLTEGQPRTGDAASNAETVETKRTGDRRHCKWCEMYKPDRCHHCRVCRMCILRMDHHCPWIYNCVGFRNHKYFFLLLVYATIACQLIIWNMFDSVKTAINKDEPIVNMFLLLFGETLAGFLGILVTLFLGFHTVLMLKAMTTIEFCEKQSKKGGTYDATIYDRGIYGNVCAVLGDNPFLWFFPVSLPSGDGLTFVDEATPLNKDMEAGRGNGRMGVRPKVAGSSSSLEGGTDSSHAFQGDAVRATAGTGSAPGSAVRLVQEPPQAAPDTAQLTAPSGSGAS